MPGEFTNPDYVDNTGIFKKPNLVTLTADADFSAAMLGAIVDLNGFELNLVAIPGQGVFELNGPGTYAGLITGTLVEGFGISINFDGTDFVISGRGVPSAHSHVQSDVTGLPAALSAAVQRANHTGTQPHTTITGLGTAAETNTGTASGNVPVLGGDGKLPAGVLPALSLTETSTVANHAARLALSAAAAQGKIIVDADTGKSWALIASGTPSNAAHWIQIGDRDINAADITNSTAAGRDLLTAADLAAQKTLLNLSGSNTGDETESTILGKLAGKLIARNFSDDSERRIILCGLGSKQISRAVSIAFESSPLATEQILRMESKLGLSISLQAFEALHVFFGAQVASGRWAAVRQMALPIWGDSAANYMDLKGGADFQGQGAVKHAPGYIQGDGVTAHLGGINAFATNGMSRTSGHVMALVYADDTRGGDHAFFGVADDTSNNGAVVLLSGDASATAYYGWANGSGSTGVGVAAADPRGVVGMNSNASHVEVLKARDGAIVSAAVAHNASYGVSTSVAPAFMAWHKNNGNIYQRTDARFGAFSIGTGMTDADARAFAVDLETLWKNATGLTY